MSSKSKPHRRRFGRQSVSPEPTHFLEIILPTNIHDQHNGIPKEFVTGFENEMCSTRDATFRVPQAPSIGPHLLMNPIAQTKRGRRSKRMASPTPLVAVPTKRRGRPPASKAPSLPAEATINSVPAKGKGRQPASKAPSPPPEATINSVPTKRRGRPPASKAPSPPAEATMNPMPEKGRGRPPVSKAPSPPAEATMNSVPEGGRGRPLRSKAPSSSPKATMNSVPAKCRGRLPKPKHEDSTNTNQIPFAQSLPPNSPAPDSSSTFNSSPERRGRPKKNTTKPELVKAHIACEDRPSQGMSSVVEELRRQLQYLQTKVKESLAVIKNHFNSANAAIQELEALAAMDLDVPLRNETQDIQDMDEIEEL